MIIIKISGGLGNQIFQYSFGRSLSLKLNTDLKFDIQTNLDIASFTKRSVGLFNFDVNLNLASAEEINQFKCFNNKYLSRTERKIIQKLPLLNKRYIVQDPYNPYNTVDSFRDNCYYDGHWQSEKFFKSIESVIRKDLEFNLKLDQVNSRLLEEIDASDSVSIHIRRGDYINIKANSKMFYTCPFEYYQKGVEILNSKSANQQYFVFSDEIDWAKKNFKGYNFRFIESNIDLPVIDLFLMTKCKNNIIANSSFSWWGAWLNQNPNKIVIAPKNWYKGSLNRIINDLIPVEWKMI